MIEANAAMEELRKAFENNPGYKPYISSIVFPNYKNIYPSSEITFDFPLTLLIGKNGTNKSSLLHALYGCPEGTSTGEYWFSTHIDPIDKKDGKRPSYFYRYFVSKTDVAEVLKTRIKSSNDPDYWEPSRPVVEYGMKKVKPIEKGEKIPPGRSQTRWNTIKKDVLYLDFRAEISAFDKAFYKENRAESRPVHKNRLRRNSKALKNAIDKGLESQIYHKKERIFANYTFSNDQIQTANKILGCDYQNIVYIEHDFYFSRSFSVYIKKNDRNDNYSEAFAGSGETSVIRLMYALDNAPEKCLVLLDEPETSLHIDAQQRLRDFIIEKIKEKHLQVVISTHSPYFAENLPECAIKILYTDAISQQVQLINSAPANESSFYLGHKRNDANKVNIIVEDSLAEAVIRYVYNKKLPDNIKDKINIIHYYGGVSHLINNAVIQMLDPSSNVYFLFDGDQKTTEAIPDPDDIPESMNNSLEELLIKTFGSCPNFPLDSNSQTQKVKFMRQFLKFSKAHFRYLPFDNPETFLVGNLPQAFSNDDINNPKKALDSYAKTMLASSGSVNSSEILTIQRGLLGQIPDEHEDFKSIKELLEEFSRYAT